MNELLNVPDDNVLQETVQEDMPAEKTAKKGKNKRKKAKKHGLTATIILFVILLGACLFILQDAVRVGVETLANSYSSAYENEKSAAYQDFYDDAYERAEQKNHVSNRAIISVSNVKETEKIQVIEVYQKEYITRERDETTDKVTAWIEVSGKGIYVVDLKTAEFIVDNEHCYVLVRVPYPELELYPLQSVEAELFKYEDIRNGSTSEGVQLTVEMLNEAVYKIKKSLMSNPYVYENAQNVAISIIENLVKELNPGIPELIVEVEFIDAVD